MGLAADPGHLPPFLHGRIDLEFLPHPPCDAPAPSPGAFRDGQAGSGIDFLHASDDAFVTGEDLEMPFAEVSAAGVAAADLDSDGVVDLFFTQTVGPNALYWGRGDGTYEPADAGPWALPGVWSGSVRAVDVDGDGRLDLEIGGHETSVLVRNLGNRVFEDITDATGITAREGWPGGAAWADVDGDGDLDLFAGGYVLQAHTFPAWTVAPTRHALWRNDDGNFVDISAGFAFDYDGHDAGATIHAAFRDMDSDGDPDLLQVNDFGLQEGSTRFWENVGDGTWSPRAPTDSGLGLLNAPMGAAITDLDGDGKTDLWFSDLGSTTAFRGFTTWSWTDVSIAWGGTLENGALDASWSAVPLDLDGDGRPGVYIGYGALPAVFRGPETHFELQPDRFLVSSRTGPETLVFDDAGGEVFPAPPVGVARGAAVADFDRNGVPDLVVGNVRARPLLLLGACTVSSRLVVEPRDHTTRNPFAVGAEITVETNGNRQVDEITAGGRGTFSSGEPVVFFGLGQAETVDRLTIRWPDGEVTERTDLPANGRLIVVRSGPARAD